MRSKVTYRCSYFILTFLMTGNSTNMLQEAAVHYISRQICNSALSYGGIIPNSSFCAGDENGNFDTCRVRAVNFTLKYFLSWREGWARLRSPSNPRHPQVYKPRSLSPFPLELPQNPGLPCPLHLNSYQEPSAAFILGFFYLYLDIELIHTHRTSSVFSKLAFLENSKTGTTM